MGGVGIKPSHIWALEGGVGCHVSNLRNNDDACSCSLFHLLHPMLKLPCCMSLEFLAPLPCH